jgi:hypothetical protein
MSKDSWEAASRFGTAACGIVNLSSTLVHFAAVRLDDTENSGNSVYRERQQGGSRRCFSGVK